MSETYKENGQDIVFDEFTKISYKIVGGSEEIIVKLGKPQKDPVWKYYCPYQIVTPGENIRHRAPGVDEFKSIQNAMRMINIELNSIVRTKSYTVKRLGHVENDLGFFEWDLVNLKDIETTLKYDDSLKSKERSKLEIESEVLNQRLEERFKKQFSPEMKEMREKRNKIAEDLKRKKDSE